MNDAAAGAKSEGSTSGHDREYPFAKDIIREGSGAVDVSLPVIAKVSALVEALRLGGSFERVYQLSSRVTPVSGQVKVDVKWSRDESLLSVPRVPCFTY